VRPEAPTIAERRAHQTVNSLHDYVFETNTNVHSASQRLRSKPMSKQIHGREGDIAFNHNTGLLGPKPLHCRRNKPLKHRPGATVGQESGNTTWTKSQVDATNKMLFDPETGLLRPRSSKQRFCCRSRSKPLKYRPVPAVGKESGNTSWTKSQAAATQKILAHVCMAQTDVAHANAAVLRMALQAPVKFCNSMKKESTYQLIWDSGASISILFDRSDFVGPMESVGFGNKLKGIAKGLSIQGKGHVLCSVLDEHGMLVTSSFQPSTFLQIEFD
jgi:hypothetical protein